MISIIVAVAENGTIGDRNTLLWHISEDLKHFKALTSGHPVIMGRKTYESLGRPLPNRTNVVLTRGDGLFPVRGSVRPLDGARPLFPAGAALSVIGGPLIYPRALPLPLRLYLTRVCHPYEGDTSFPDWDESEWRLISSEAHPCGREYPHPFVFECWERRRPGR